MDKFSLYHKNFNWPDVNEFTWKGYDKLSVETFISFDTEEPKQSHKAAISNGFVIYPSRALKCYGYNIENLFASFDAEVWGFYKDCELRKVFDRILPDKVVVISQVGVNPKYRNLNIGISVVKSWIYHLQSGETLFLLYPGETYGPNDEYSSWLVLDDLKSHKRRSDNPGDVLARYWRKAGFKDWPGTNPMTHAYGRPNMYYSTVALDKVITNLNEKQISFEQEYLCCFPLPPACPDCKNGIIRETKSGGIRCDGDRRRGISPCGFKLV